MAWIESHSVLIDHRKLREAANLLNIKSVYMLGHLHAFWHKVIELAEDGDISSWSADDIAYYSRFDGDSQAFFDVLKDRFIDVYPDGKKIIHDWLDYAGYFLDRKYSSGKPEKLKEIWKIHGYKYGKGKGKYTKSKADSKRTISGQKAELPNQPNQPNLKDICASFEKFWTAYPKKKSKGDAEKAFKSINPSEQLVETMISKIKQAKTSIEWTKDKGQFISYPATWLRARGWEDEYTQPAATQTQSATPEKPKLEPCKNPECVNGWIPGEMRGQSSRPCECRKRLQPAKPPPVSAEIKGLVAGIGNKIN